MRIIIDGDSCPVINTTITLCKTYQKEVIIVTDTAHYFQSDYAKIIIVDIGKESVDFKIINLVESEDLIITQDYGLATMCLAKKCRVINQNGFEYNHENIEELLFSRHIIKNFRKNGKYAFKISKRTKDDDKKFENLLKNLLLEENA